MIIRFDSEADSCCPSLGDITCDYTEAQAMKGSAAVTTSDQRSSRPGENSFSEKVSQPKSSRRNADIHHEAFQQRRLSSPRKGSPQQRKYKNSSHRKHFHSPVLKENEVSPREDRRNGIPEAPNLDGFPSPTKQTARYTLEGDIVFQMGKISFQKAPPNIYMASIVADGKQSNIAPNNNHNTSHNSIESCEDIVLLANDSLDSIFLPETPMFKKKTPKAPSTSGINDGPKRRSTDVPEDFDAKFSLSKEKEPEKPLAQQQETMSQQLKSTAKRMQGQKVFVPAIWGTNNSATNIEVSGLDAVSTNNLDNSHVVNVQPGRETEGKDDESSSENPKCTKSGCFCYPAPGTGTPNPQSDDVAESSFSSCNSSDLNTFTQDGQRGLRRARRWDGSTPIHSMKSRDRRVARTLKSLTDEQLNKSMHLHDVFDLDPLRIADSVHEDSAISAQDEELIMMVLERSRHEVCDLKNSKDNDLYSSSFLAASEHWDDVSNANSGSMFGQNDNQDDAQARRIALVEQETELINLAMERSLLEH